ncbi:MAG: tail fiber protein [Aquabacterium sp.]|nr:tail fiber protein [Aquabacterium sp.]
MAEAFVAEIRIFGFNFAPRGWAFCDGQLLPIAQNTALFSLLGTNYGGDGRSTFGLPDLRGRFALHQGQGPGLSDRIVGETGGQASVSLLASQMPAHSHALQAAVSPTTAAPAGAALAPTANGTVVYRSGAANAQMAASSIGSAGTGQAHENRQPLLGLNFCIALRGIFPPRS